MLLSEVKIIFIDDCKTLAVNWIAVNNVIDNSNFNDFSDVSLRGHVNVDSGITEINDGCYEVKQARTFKH